MGFDITAACYQTGRALAPRRLVESDARALKKFRVEVYGLERVQGAESRTVSLKLHVDRDPRRLAAAKLGKDAAHVLVTAKMQFFSSVTTIFVVLDDGNRSLLADHKFRDLTDAREWQRVLSRHVRHAFGVLTHLRAATLPRPSPSPSVSKVS